MIINLLVIYICSQNHKLRHHPSLAHGGRQSYSLPAKTQDCFLVKDSFMFYSIPVLFLQMLSSKDINFVGYTYKNFEIVNDYQVPGMGEYIWSLVSFSLSCLNVVTNG